METNNTPPRIGGVSISEKGIRPHRGDSRKSGIAEYGTILFTNQKTGTLTTTHQPYIIDNAICVASRGRNTAPDGSIEQHLELCPEPGKTNFLTTVSKDNLIMETQNEKDTRYISGTYRTHKVDGGFRKIKSSKGACVPARARQDGSGQNVCMVIPPNGTVRIRRLTPTECARLQTIPDWYKWVVSETLQYKMLGNGWTVEVIKHIFSFLPDRFKQ